MSKVSLTEREAGDAKRLIAGLDDWSRLGRTAERKFSLPLLYYHLAQLDFEGPLAEFVAAMKKRAQLAAFHNMALFGSHKQFLERVLLPEAVPGIFFKGVSMAAQFYPAIGLRPCRDIDVIVPADRVRGVLSRAVEEGFVPVSPDQAARPLKSPRDLDVQVELTGGSILLSPAGHVIDLQSRLDKHSDIFAGYGMFKHAQTFSYGPHAFNVFPLPFLFNYLTHHHARHTWSRLHWLSDIDAVCTSPGFDRREALDTADALGQRGNVEAALELRDLMSTDTGWDNSTERERGKAFLRLGISNLTGDLDLEKRISFHLKGGEFMYDWQASPELVARARRRRRTAILRPTVTQYAAFPLPRGLRWLYFVPRLYVLAHHAIQRLFPKGS